MVEEAGRRVRRRFGRVGAEIGSADSGAVVGVGRESGKIVGCDEGMERDLNRVEGGEGIGEEGVMATACGMWRELEDRMEEEEGVGWEGRSVEGE